MKRSDNTIREIVVVGGGSAGWLSAGLLAAQLKQTTGRDYSVTLIESPDISTVGVGEGSWPSMRHTLQQIGLDEKIFMAHCQATFKQGSCFVNWGANSTSDVYYHPFTNPIGYGDLELVKHWRQSNSDRPFADFVDGQSRLISESYAPKQFATPNYAGVCNYGYHFDAAAMASLLKSHCINQLGVRYICDHVDAVLPSSEHLVRGLQLRRNGLLTGDFYVDCSGSQSLLLKSHFESKWTDVSSILFNDSALAVQVPYDSDDTSIASATIATGQKYGWTWDINLQSRRGVGHVFSSRFGSVSEIEKALEVYIQKRSPTFTLSSMCPRLLHFNPGYLSTPWRGNCVAVGMAAGFVEPLEASSLAMTELALTMILEQFPRNDTHLSYCENQFNQRFNYRWERVVDFLKLHYVLSNRCDSEYWLAHRQKDSVPERLAALLKHWKYVPPSRFDLPENEEVFSSASYQYVLYGMRPDYTSFEGPFDSKQRMRCELALDTVENKYKQCVAGLPRHTALLSALFEQTNVKAG